MKQLHPSELPEALQPRYDRVHRRMALRRAWNVVAPCLVACVLFATIAALGAVAWTVADMASCSAAVGHECATQQQLIQEEPISP